MLHVTPPFILEGCLVGDLFLVTPISLRVAVKLILHPHFTSIPIKYLSFVMQPQKPHLERALATV